jgi:hypothetical protein
MEYTPVNEIANSLVNDLGYDRAIRYADRIAHNPFGCDNRIKADYQLAKDYLELHHELSSRVDYLIR